MKKYHTIFFRFFLISLFFFSLSINAQDLLVTKSMDTLNCRIGKLENDRYIISFYQNDQKMEGYIHKDSILFLKKNVFRSLRSNRLLLHPVTDLSIDAGVTHQYGTFQIEDDLTSKSDIGARTGFYIGADVILYPNKHIGFGAKYNFRSLLGGDILYHYAGPLMTWRIWEKNNKNYWFLTASFGWAKMIQKNAPVEGILERQRIAYMSANTFGGDLSVGYHYRLSQRVSARIKLSGIIGWPNRVTVRDPKKYSAYGPVQIGDYCDNMNTLNLSVGFTFHRIRPSH